MNTELNTAVETERAIIGAIIVDGPEAIDKCEGLKEEDFYNDECRLLFKTLLSMRKRGEPIDIITVVQRLKDQGDLEKCGGAYGVSTFTNIVSSSMNTAFQSRIVMQKALSRNVAKALADGFNKLNQHGHDVFDVSDSIVKNINQSLEGIAAQSPAKPILHFVNELLNDCVNALDGKRWSVPIENRLLDSTIGGVNEGKIYIVAARPGMGKTAFALSNCVFVAKQNIPVGFFSLEMSAKELAGRLLANVCGINSTKINNGLIDQDEYTVLSSTNAFDKLPLYIDDRPCSFEHLVLKIRQMHRQQGVKLVCIDYLQLIDFSASRESREQQIAKMSRGLKLLAKELQIPIIVLSQLNRESENRPDRKPRLSDLRESGAIEQDADSVIILFRPEEVGMTSYPVNGVDVPTDGLLMSLVVKNRGGRLGEIPMRWDGRLMRITEY